MDKSDTGTNKFVHRHLSQLKVLSRLLEHELDASKGSAEVTLDRELFENLLDTVEIFVEDVEREHGGRAVVAAKPAEKPAVTRLN
ncbi:MAG: hypothetical protein IT457_04095 [Planctomycetes bacterium]|jgi:hypothetical protein|nr:hypothetical protein [Planctomycetota bacterium]